MGWAVRFVCLSLALSPGPSTVSAHSKCSLLAGEWTLFTSSPGPLPWTHQAPPCPSAPWCHPQLAPTPSLLRSAPVLHPVGVSPPPLFLIMPICQRHNQVPPPGSLPSTFKGRGLTADTLWTTQPPPPLHKPTPFKQDPRK